MKWGLLGGFFLVLAAHADPAGGLPAPFAPGAMPVNLAAYVMAEEPDYAAAKKATMRFATPEWVCSATAIRPGHHQVLTAEHCIAHGTDGITLGTRTARVIHVEHTENDAVILTTDLYFENVASFGPRPRQGDVVFSHGNPATTPDILLIGRVAGWVAHYMGHDDVMLLDRNDWYGCSGAAVFDTKGRVVGIVNAIYPWPNDGWRLSAVYPLTFTPAQLIAGLTEEETMAQLGKDLAELQRELQ